MPANEPRRSRTRKALFVLLLALILVAVAYTYFQENKPWVIPEEAKARKNPLQPSEAALKSAKAFYGENCANCHGDSGKGDGSEAIRFHRRPAHERRHRRRALLPNQPGQKAHARFQEAHDRRPALAARPARPLFCTATRLSREETRRGGLFEQIIFGELTIASRRTALCFPNSRLRIYPHFVPRFNPRRLMRHFLAALICVFLLPAFTHAAPGAVRCGKLLDVRSGKILTDQAAVFDDGGTITSVSSFTSAKFPSGVVAMDLGNATCLPGLIDVHTHLTADPTANGYAGLGISVPREAVTG